MSHIVRAKVHHHAHYGSGACVAIVNFPEPGEVQDPLAAAERAYELTNTIHNVWWENDNVEMVGPARERGSWRSTSVGDRIVIEYADGDRDLYTVDDCGFYHGAK